MTGQVPLVMPKADDLERTVYLGKHKWPAAVATSTEIQ
jgi:hypothetical protein